MRFIALFIAVAALVLGAATAPSLAKPKDKGEKAHSREVRNPNANPQWHEDSKRGLERAAERRGPRKDAESEWDPRDRADSDSGDSEDADSDSRDRDRRKQKKLRTDEARKKLSREERREQKESSKAERGTEEDSQLASDALATGQTESRGFMAGVRRFFGFGRSAEKRSERATERQRAEEQDRAAGARDRGAD